MNLGLITCSKHPHFHPEDTLLAAELAKLGVTALPVNWEEPIPTKPEWAGLVVRTPWNYHRHLAQFLTWIEAAQTRLPMWNSLEVVRWNSHKRYLAQLSDEGLPVVPTRVFEPGQQLDAAELMGWAAGRPLVAKPAVSAGAFKTARYPQWSEEVLAHLQDLLSSEPAMLQPYYSRIETEGEKSLIFFDGVFSHAVRRHLPLVEGPEVDYLMKLVEPNSQELAVAQEILEGLPYEDLLYARVDLIPDPQGRPVLLEIELIEPQLFLREFPPGAGALARACRARLD